MHVHGRGLQQIILHSEGGALHQQVLDQLKALLAQHGSGLLIQGHRPYMAARVWSPCSMTHEPHHQSIILDLAMLFSQFSKPLSPQPVIVAACHRAILASSSMPELQLSSLMRILQNSTGSSSHVPAGQASVSQTFMNLHSCTP